MAAGERHPQPPETPPPPVLAPHRVRSGQPTPPEPIPSSGKVHAGTPRRGSQRVTRHPPIISTLARARVGNTYSCCAIDPCRGNPFQDTPPRGAHGRPGNAAKPTQEER